MKNLDTLKIGKYTFYISFLIGSILLLGFLVCATFHFGDIGWCPVILGFYYLFLASAINILIIIFLSVYCTYIKEDMKTYLKAIGYILLNIPIAALYVMYIFYLPDIHR